VAEPDVLTRDRLLLTAERLLLDRGFEAVSIRAVCAEANANVAAVHYHFGSKDDLVAALLEARLGPVWEPSIAELTAPNAGVADFVSAVVGPLADLAADPAGRLYLHLLARLVLGRRRVGWAARWFGLDPWVELLRRARPDLTDAEAQARWMIAFELLLAQFGDPLAGDRVLSPAAVSRLRAFITAGLSAPAGTS
jgi:AcrR family transcriptional regulator